MKLLPSFRLSFQNKRCHLIGTLTADALLAVISWRPPQIVNSMISIPEPIRSNLLLRTPGFDGRQGRRYDNMWMDDEGRKGTHKCVRPRIYTGDAKIHVNVKVKVNGLDL